MTKSDFDQAEHLSRRRARTLPALAAIYFSQQAVFFSSVHGDRTVDHVKVGAWVVMSAVLLAALLTRGAWFQPRAVRALLDDERTQANRMLAIRDGFVAAIGVAIFVYFADQFAPISARQAIHLIVSLSLGIALLRFGIMEGRDQQDD